MLNIVIFGAPGSGKGTQSELIIKEYGLDHISTGDVLRSEIKNETELGKIAKGFIEKGQLVPDELIVDMLAKVLDSKENSKGVIFDGFPRTIPQAKALKEMLNQRGTDVSIMLNLQVDEEELISRLLERGKVSGRSDDNLETIKKIRHLDIQGVKFHSLFIEKDTRLEKMFKELNLHVLELDEYIDIVISQLELLPEHIVIQRLTGDPVASKLSFPLWSIKKINVLNGIDKEMRKRSTFQGRLYE